MSEQQHSPRSQYGALALQLKHRALLLLILIACGFILFYSYPRQTTLETILDNGEIRVITRLSPSLYYLENDQPGGFEYELTKLYANYLGVDLSIVSASDISQLFAALRLNNAHYAAAGLGVTAARQEKYRFSPAYAEPEVHLVYLQRRGFSAPKDYSEVEGTIRVASKSGYADLLRQIDPEQDHWQTSEYDDALSLLEMVHNQTLDFTLIDADRFNANRNFFPRLAIAFTLPQKLPIAWMMKERKDDSLLRSMEAFFQQPETERAIAALHDKYFSSDQSLDLVDNLTFRKHLEERLPLYRDLFLQAAEETGEDWKLLAAIGYQESHWNPKAVSPTGVRGIMMLTRQTAKGMGVTERTDPEQSIMGGAKYFKLQKERMPDRITGPDRTWFALASYNVGRGHLEDARILTERAGMNPDNWDDVAKHLPLLSQARWYKTVRHGYARGREPVIYVNNIKRYLEQLELETRLEAVQLAQDEEDQRAMDELQNPPESQTKELLPETL